MNELKPEDVMRALECCQSVTPLDCRKCPYKDQTTPEYKSCCNLLVSDALALLREKDAAHKELWEERMRIYQDLQEYKAECKKLLEEFNKLIDEKDAEIERLQGALKAEERHNELTMECAKKALANARSEAITEFAERVKKWFCADAFYNNNYVLSVVRNIASEMKEASENG
jgi:hypothetical protein